jgi:carbonic anhydrase
MKRFTVFCVIMATIAAMSACTDNTATTATQNQTAIVHNPEEKVADWEKALQYLKDGNLRYVDDQLMARDSNDEDRDALADGQNPFAVVVTCSDSRVSPEVYLDQKLGDIFVIRNAGNISDPTTLGSIEYAAEHLGSPLIAVVGHSSCGAVTGAFEGGEFPENLETIIHTIQTSIAESSDLDNAIDDNILSTVTNIEQNEIIEELGTKVIGANYNIETGEIVWFE